ncbi:hypothetical protein Golax_015888, partial [Gossypium laxum]|nr:hypothetical protein [Gossypium laxum]
GDVSLYEIAKECYLLEKLDLCQCPAVSSKGLIAIAENCLNLTALSIESCPKIGNESLQAVGKLCPKLQSISIKDCPLVGDHGVASLFSLASSVLSKVKLEGLKISDFSLSVIGYYGKSVTNLMLSGLRNVSEKGFWVMGNAQGLQNCRFVSDDGLLAFSKSQGSLECLQLEECNKVTQSGIIGFLSN